MDETWRKSIFQLLPLDGRYFLTVALKYYIITVVKMKNATVALFVLFQLIFNREWMITALIQTKYLNSINE